MAVVKRKINPAIFFIVGTVCLIGLHSQFLLLEIESFIFDKNYTEFSITESVTHWILICVVWGILGIALFYIVSRVYGYDIMKKEQRPDTRDIIIAIMLLSSSIGVKYILLGGWQMAIDFKQQGWFQFIFLYLYYLFEALIVLLSAIFFQEGCEMILKNKTPFAFGGTTLALTWGLTHFITRGDMVTALYYTVVAFFIGCAYLTAKKNFYIAYIFAVVLIII